MHPVVVVMVVVGAMLLALGLSTALVAFTHDDALLSDYRAHSVWAVLVGLVLVTIGYFGR